MLHRYTTHSNIALQAKFLTRCYICEGTEMYFLCGTETEGASEQLEGKQRQAAGGSGPTVSGDRTAPH